MPAGLEVRVAAEARSRLGGGRKGKRGSRHGGKLLELLLETGVLLACLKP